MKDLPAGISIMNLTIAEITSMQAFGPNTDLIVRYLEQEISRELGRVEDEIKDLSLERGEIQLQLLAPLYMNLFNILALFETCNVEQAAAGISDLRFMIKNMFDCIKVMDPSLQTIKETVTNVPPKSRLQ